MFCASCGTSNPDTALSCGRCGKVLQGAPTLQGQPGVQPVQSVPNYLVWAILTTLFCCLPAGIVSIVYAAQVNGKLQAGDVAGAQEASKNAKTWCLVSAGVGLGITLLYILAMVGGLLSRH
jgi:hypothetical protein